MPLAPHEIVAEFIAAAVVEWSYDKTVQIGVTVDGDRATIIDNGRGMQVAPDEGETIGHAEKALTTAYPILASDPGVDRVLDEVVRGGRPSQGVSAAAAACPHLRFVSRRGHDAAAQSFDHGVAGPPERLLAPYGQGTTIELRTATPIDLEAVVGLTEHLRHRFSGLTIAGPDARVRKAARILVTTAEGHVLLFRGSDPARPEAGSWWFPVGGELNAGETFPDAARRELWEETGLRVESVGPIIADRFAVFSFLDELLHSREAYFRIEVERFDISDAGWEDEERGAISDHRWWSRAELEATTDTVFPEAILALLTGESEGGEPSLST